MPTLHKIRLKVVKYEFLKLSIRRFREVGNSNGKRITSSDVKQIYMEIANSSLNCSIDSNSVCSSVYLSVCLQVRSPRPHRLLIIGGCSYLPREQATMFSRLCPLYQVYMLPVVMVQSLHSPPSKIYPGSLLYQPLARLPLSFCLIWILSARFCLFS